ncbi:YbaB/EbfC family nucleoid-associated protein [Candidatus Proelusimicrobium excrementi]|uniref:YbaB/EbfC family nucleoid-associated protein n=1 Tax=Candidatus Proelusimicrobium excrementi TaxID=3416222 RepID=UPI003C81526F|nr:YbaB/EbfC family nucleoid-associated protein [Elusimicrobiaceae bacterium]
MFDNLKKLMELKKTMTEVKKRLDEMVIKVESPAKNFEMTISGSQQVKEMKVLTDLKNLSKEEAEKDLAELFNKAVRDSQAMAAQAMGGLANLGL